jgi:magnesium transporter
VRTKELLRVLVKEASLGVINGIALGTLLGSVAFLWKGSWVLGLVVGSALALNTIVAVSLGGLLPLVLKRFKMDPALVASPVLTTVTDMCGFFFVLSFASLMLGRLA